MNVCRNVLEELVIEEAKAQINRLSAEARAKVSLSEVVAYALNRLPPMYATTQRGWIQQRKRAHSELKQEIVSAVRRAMLGVRQDTLRESTPLPFSELEDQAHVLARLQQILGRADMKWKDIPAAVEDALMTVKLKGAINYRYQSSTRRSAVGINDYLKRTKAGDFSWKGKQAVKTEAESAKPSIEAKEFASYMAAATYNFSNTLVKLVMWIAEQQIQRLEPSIAEQISLEEVAAYALNRLPPMYATSDRGLKQQRTRAKAELANEIMAAVRQGISVIMRSPKRTLQPLPFEKFEIEQEQALEQLKQVLLIDDINWRNVASIVEDALERTQSGELVWQRPGHRQSTVVNW